MTTREEQEQYKLRGMADGKVEELLDLERSACLKRQKTGKADGIDDDKASQEDGDSSEAGDTSIKDYKQENQDKKKKRKKRKKKGNQANQKGGGQGAGPDDQRVGERFRHNIMASHDL